MRMISIEDSPNSEKSFSVSINNNLKYLLYIFFWDKGSTTGRMVEIDQIKV